MPNWNPSTPRRVGPEVLPAGTRQSQTLSALGSVLVQRFDSTAAQTITALRLHGRISHDLTGWALFAAILGADPVIAEIAPGQPAVPSITVSEYAPTADGAVVNSVTREPGAHTTSRFTAINDWNASPHDDYLAFGPESSFDFAVNAGAFAAGRRVYSLAVDVWGTSGYQGNTVATQRRRVAVSVVIGGVVHPIATRVIPHNNAAGEGGVSTFDLGEINPATMRPWTQADVVAFASGGTSRVRFARVEGDTHIMRISAARMRVAHAPETRVAIAVATPFSFPNLPAGAADWTANLTLIASWAKPSSGTFHLAVRRANRGDRAMNWMPVTVGYIEAAEALPASLVSSVPTWSTRREGLAVVAPSSVQSAAASLAAGRRPRLAPFVLRTASAQSNDSQPYATLSGEPSVDVRQRIVGGTGITVIGARAVLMFGTAPTATPRVRVAQASDNATLGFLQASPVEVATPGAPVVVELRADWPIALPGDVDLDFLPMFADARWDGAVPLLRVDESGGGLGLVNGAYGNVGHARVDGVAVNATVPVYLVEEVAPPSSFGVSAIDRPLPDPCGIDSYPDVVAGWGPSSFVDAPSSGGHYELERSDDRVPRWERVADVYSAPVLAIADDEARLGVRVGYRVRAVGDDGRVSAWLDEIDDSVQVGNDSASWVETPPDPGIADVGQEFAVVAHMTMPSTGVVARTIAGTYLNDASGGWRLWITAGARLGFRYSTGSATVSVTGPSVAAIPAGTRLVLGVERTWTGSTFSHRFVAGVDGETWSTTDQATNAATIGAATGRPLRIGNNPGGGVGLDARVRRVEVRAGGLDLPRRVDVDLRRVADAPAVAVVGVAPPFQTTLPVTLGASVDVIAAPHAVTPVLPGPGYVFTSNVARRTPLYVGVVEVIVAADVYDDAAARPYMFPEAEERIIRRMFGRRLPVVFRPPTTRGEQFTRTLSIARLRGCGAGKSVVGQGPEAFARLRELCASPALPYVCVRDEAGNRWFASVAPIEGVEHRNRSLAHDVVVEVIETVDEPAPVVLS